jgi:hypothetical protein
MDTPSLTLPPIHPSSKAKSNEVFGSKKKHNSFKGIMKAESDAS